MLEEAVKQGMPHAYKDDLLYHDRVILGLYHIPEQRREDGWEIEEGGAFGWILREHGTEILHVCHDDAEFRAGAETIGRYYGMGAGVKTECPNLFYFWDGANLHDVGSYRGLEEAASRHRCLEVLKDAF
jgi:hypothetical protein